MCSLIIQGSLFKFNKAMRYGAAIKFQDIDANIGDVRNTFIDNESPTNTDVSSYPSQLFILKENAYSTDIGILVSGGTSNFVIELLDIYNKTFEKENLVK